ncbi:hypothetical protein WJX72_004331 [[Myrmecia] bisecta]|uniref:SET domain-containing protein n=1 Tax=[Myrmecia] bisecta TaxID=41462 RepID=A0AAW1P3Z3_9CHLO
MRGLQATQPVAAGEDILSITFHRCLSIVSAMHRTKDWQRAVIGWRRLPDADMYLDVLALLYETVVKGNNSEWAPYLRTLPQEYDLPVNYSAAVHEQVLSALPGLHELANKRISSLHHFYPLMFKALQALPGGKEGLHRLGSSARWPLFLWAYSATKTRTVTLDVADSGVKVPGDWVHEIGVMVPLLDMTNHGVGGQVNARVEGTSAAFKLIATRAIQAHQQVRFSYNPSDEETANCNDRWLLEYGFTIDDDSPERSCYRLQLSSGDVAAALAHLAVASSPPSASQAGSEPSADACTLASRARIRSRLDKARLPEEMSSVITAATVSPPHELWHWLQVAVGGSEACIGEWTSTYR